jgi:uncharacterized membrane protein YkoI
LRVEPSSAIIGIQMKLITLKATLPTLAAALFTALCCTAQADQNRVFRDQGGAQGFAPHTAAERRVTLAQAIEVVQRATGGKVLDAKDLGRQYRIKVLTRSGEVRVVYVDAETGAMR